MNLELPLEFKKKYLKRRFLVSLPLVIAFDIIIVVLVLKLFEEMKDGLDEAIMSLVVLDIVGIAFCLLTSIKFLISMLRGFNKDLKIFHKFSDQEIELFISEYNANSKNVFGKLNIYPHFLFDTNTYQTLKRSDIHGFQKVDKEFKGIKKFFLEPKVTDLVSWDDGDSFFFKSEEERDRCFSFLMVR